jgi:hypothetical protein
VDSISELEDQGLYMKSNERDPERQTFDGEIRQLLEKAFDALPSDYRSVFMLREIEGLSTAETAECLEISEENVKTRPIALVSSSSVNRTRPPVRQPRQHSSSSEHDATKSPPRVMARIQRSESGSSAGRKFSRD